MGAAIDLTGQVFSRLTVIREVAARYLAVKDGRRRQRQWECLCVCGCKIVVIGQALTSGNTKSCGCLSLDRLQERSTKHGHALRGHRSRTYKVWRSMIDRCTLPSCKDYRNWGGRGIAVCDFWRVFDNFLADMGEAPVGMTLDRRDNERGYSKKNCRWATSKEQGNNRRSNHRLTYGGETMTLTEWAERTGLGKAALRYRVASGWSIKDALSKPIPKRKPK
jgi:hypothetical protein